MDSALPTDYFQYYASLQNQANMIQDFSRTQTYRRAILGNAIPAFENKIVIDIGAGQSPICLYLGLHSEGNDSSQEVVF